MAPEVLPQGRSKLYSLTCKLLQGNKIKKDHKDNISVKSSEGDIVFDCCIKSYDSWVAGVKFLQETGHKRVQLANAFTKKDADDKHAKLGVLTTDSF